MASSDCSPRRRVAAHVSSDFCAILAVYSSSSRETAAVASLA